MRRVLREVKRGVRGRTLAAFDLELCHLARVPAASAQTRLSASRDAAPRTPSQEVVVVGGGVVVGDRLRRAASSSVGDRPHAGRGASIRNRRRVLM